MPPLPCAPEQLFPLPRVSRPPLPLLCATRSHFTYSPSALLSPPHHTTHYTANHNNNKGNYNQSQDKPSQAMKLVRINNILLVVPFLLAVSSPFLASAQEATAATPSLRGTTNEKDIAATTGKQTDNVSNLEVSPTAPIVSPVVEPVPPVEPVKAEGGIEVPGEEGNKQSWWNSKGRDRGNFGGWYVEGEEGIKEQQQQVEGHKQEGRFAWTNKGRDRGNFGGW